MSCENFDHMTMANEIEQVDNTFSLMVNKMQGISLSATCLISSTYFQTNTLLCFQSRYQRYEYRMINQYALDSFSISRIRDSCSGLAQGPA